MKTTLILFTFASLVYSFILGRNFEKQAEQQSHTIQVLRGDSVLIHTFFEEQSRNYDDFYVDFVNFKVNKQ
jgi:hypothetical protein